MYSTVSWCVCLLVRKTIEWVALCQEDLIAVAEKDRNRGSRLTMLHDWPRNQMKSQGLVCCFWPLLCFVLKYERRQSSGLMLSSAASVERVSTKLGTCYVRSGITAAPVLSAARLIFNPLASLAENQNCFCVESLPVYCVFLRTNSSSPLSVEVPTDFALSRISVSMLAPS